MLTFSLAAALELIIGARAQVMRITAMVLLSTFSSNIPMRYPVLTTARATAVCAAVRPNIRLRLLLSRPACFCAIHAGSHLETRATVSITALIASVEPSASTRRFIIMPTPIRKYGMNMALPTNSIELIRGEAAGT